MRGKSTIAFAFLLLLTVSACQPEEIACDDPENFRCPNYEPCLAIPAARSNFNLIADLANLSVDTTLIVDIDTTWAGGRVTLQAEEDRLVDYKWTVGTDPRVFEGERIEINFTGFAGGTVPVTLVTTADTTSTCLSQEEWSASRTQDIHIVGRTAESRVFGTFRGGVIEEETDTVCEVKIAFDSNLRPYLHDLPVPADCDFSQRGIPILPGYRLFASKFTNQFRVARCRELSVFGQMEAGSSEVIRIGYHYKGDDGRLVRRTFVGTRL